MIGFNDQHLGENIILLAMSIQIIKLYSVIFYPLAAYTPTRNVSVKKSIYPKIATEPTFPSISLP